MEETKTRRRPPRHGAASSSRHRSTRRECLKTDVLVSGGGISGLTAALLLARAGKHVTVLGPRERELEAHETLGVLSQRVGGGFASLVRTHGLGVAQALATSTSRAISTVRELSREMGGCNYQRISGFLFDEREDALRALREECDAARAVGLRTQVTREVPLPSRTAGGVLFPGQAEFSPTLFLEGLRRLALAAGCVFLSESRIQSLNEGEPCIVRMLGETEVRATSVFLAAQQPFLKFPFLAGLAPRKRKVVAVRHEELSPSVFWNADSGFHQLHASAQSGRGAAFFSSDDDQGAGYNRLVQDLSRRLGRTTIEVLSVGATDVMHPTSGVPLIRWRRPNSPVFVAAGFGHNVWTLSVVAALAFTDAVLARFNPHEEASRIQSPAA
jgi:glycine/D-amino acid oxidase-like deaminating enzyme